MSDFCIRSLTWDDLSSLHETTVEAARADGEDHFSDQEVLRVRFSAPHMRLEDCQVAADPGGRVVGFCAVEVRDSRGRGFGWGAVHPDYRRRGLGARLLRAADEHFLARRAGKPAEMPIYIDRHIPETSDRTAALLAGADYRIVRWSYTMRRELGQTLEEAVLPEGLVLRPFVRERDARAVHAAMEEAFRDHWGHTEDTPFPIWEHIFLEVPDHDPSLWLIARDGEQVAGLCLCNQARGDYPGMGWVNVLGVRRPWRRRGLGAALLRMSFNLFRERGLVRAGLGVDAENTSNAVALYQSVGMEVHKKYPIYRKVLRGREEDI